MTPTAYPVYAPAETMLEARQRYFAANGFGEDGGYNKKVEIFKLGPIPVPVLNTASRVKALQFHDLHHVLTGYNTDWKGEFEISGWEIGAGCGRLWFAWYINLQGLAMGMLLIPRRTIRAFLRGRRSRSLYGEDPRAVLERTVGEAREMTGVDAPLPAMTAGDAAALAGWMIAAEALVLAHLAPLAAAAWGLWALLR